MATHCLTSSTILSPDASTPARATERTRWVGLAALACGLGMIVLDGTIVGVALPVLVADLHLSLTSAQWVTSLYSVVFAALLLAFGALADQIGRRRVFAAGIVVFLIGSLLAAASRTAGPLLVARAVQGVGGAGVLPASLSTVNATFRGRDRAVAFGVWGAVMSGVAAIGPLLGGWITTQATWPWVFLVNLPFGALVLLGVWRAVPESRGANRSGVDVGGIVLSAAGLGLVVFGLIEATDLGWWHTRTPVNIGGLVWPWHLSAAPVAIVVGLGLVGLFVAWESRLPASRALLDIRLLRIGTFTAGNLTAATVAVAEFALVFVLPLYLVEVRGLDTLGAGAVLSAMAVGAFISGASARRVSARLGAPRVVVLGVGLEVVGVGLLLVFLDAGVIAMMATLVVYGVGLGLASAQLTSTVLRDVPVDLSGVGSATQSTVRQVGSALGTAVAGSVLGAWVGSGLSGDNPAAFGTGTRWVLGVVAGVLAIAVGGATLVVRLAEQTPEPTPVAGAADQ